MASWNWRTYPTQHPQRSKQADPSTSFPQFQSFFSYFRVRPLIFHAETLTSDSSKQANNSLKLREWGANFPGIKTASECKVWERMQIRGADYEVIKEKYLALGPGRQLGGRGVVALRKTEGDIFLFSCSNHFNFQPSCVGWCFTDCDIFVLGKTNHISASVNRSYS